MERTAVSRTVNPNTGLTIIPDGVHAGAGLDEIRSKASGLHFAKECLSPGEREILYLVEALLHVLDAEAGGYRR